MKRRHMWSVGSEQDAAPGKAEALVYCRTEDEGIAIIDMMAVMDPAGVHAGLYSLNEPEASA